MSKNFIFNMGYDTSHVTSVLAREEVSSGSRVILIISSRDDERQSNAIQDIRNYLDSLNFDVDLEVFEAGKSFQEDVLSFSQLVSDIDNLVLSLSGGPRDFLIPLTVSTVLSPSASRKVYLRGDVDSELREINVPTANYALDQTERNILDSLAGEEKKVEQIMESNSVDCSESTLYRRLKDLRKKKLIGNNSDLYGLTTAGEIVRNQ